MINNKFTITFLAILLFNACQTTEEPLAIEENDAQFKVSNESATLNSRVTHTNEPVNILAYNAAGGRLTSDVSLTLVSEIASPQVNGEPVMATSISEHEDNLIVSYNTAGSGYAGGAVVLSREDAEMEIVSEVLFPGADVSHSIISNNRLFIAGAVNKGELPSRVSSFELSGGMINENTFREVSLGGYVATSLVGLDRAVYATSGAGIEAGSGVFEIQPSNLTVTNQALLSDPRWSANLGETLYVQNGIPGSIEVFEQGINTRSIAISDADRDAKSSFDIVDEYIFAGVGQNGVEIFSVDGDYQGNIPLPTFASSDFTTNAVAVYGDMIFIANGTTVFVATYSSDEDLNPEVVGELELGDFESVNHILFQDNYLIVSAGLGGVKVIRIDRNNTPPEEGEILAKSGMEVIYFDSQEPKRDRYASYVLDGDLNSFWHTEWVDQDPVYPHELWIDLGQEYELSEFRYTARQLGNFNGTVSAYELYLSDSTASWGTAFHTGTFEKTREEQIAVFDNPVQGRYFRFVALSEVNGNPWTSCAELDFVGIEAP